MLTFSGRHYPKSIILQSVRWYVSYALSYRNIEEMMKERGFTIDHATLNRWFLHYSPLLEEKSRKFKRPVHRSWRMDETYIKIKGKWREQGGVRTFQQTPFSNRREELYP